MRESQAVIVADSTPLRQAAETLITSNNAVLVATNKDGTIAGLVPEAAIIRHLMATPNRNETITPILSRHVETVRPDANINSVLHLFRSSCHSVIPVVGAADQIVGLLYRSDVVRMLLEESSASDSESSVAERQKPHFLDRSEQSSGAQKSSETQKSPREEAE